jgi:hypothetical protein
VVGAREAPARPPVRRRRLRLPVAPLAILAVLAVCASGLVLLAARSSDSVLQVNGWELSRAELRDELDRIEANPAYRAARGHDGQPLAVFRPGSTTDYDPALVAELLNERTTFRLASEEVAARKLAVTDEDRAAARAVLEDGMTPAGAPAAGAGPGGTVPPPAAALDALGPYKDVLLAGVADLQALQRVLGPYPGVDLDTAAHLLYDQARDTTATQACVRHVLVVAGPPITGDPNRPVPTEGEYAGALVQAEALRARVAAGTPLEDLAAESGDPVSKDHGGDLGCAPRGKYAPAFDAAAWDQPVGEVGAPVRTEYGYHLVQVYERGVRPVEELLPSLRDTVTQERQRTLQGWLEGAARKAKVAVDPGVGRWNAEKGVVEQPDAGRMALQPQTPGTGPGPAAPTGPVEPAVPPGTGGG